MTLELYKIVNAEDNYLRVSIPGDDFVLLNTLRKIILNEIPSMAITSVYITENTSSLVDEVLGHRIGLLHLFAADSDFSNYEDDDLYDERNSIQFNLNVIYTPEKNRVLASDLIWIPEGKQEKYLTLTPRVVNKGSVICRLAYGQRVELSAYATKGCGKVHSKFNVVSTCYYTREEDNKSFSFILKSENGIDPEIILKQGLKILRDKVTSSQLASGIGVSISSVEDEGDEDDE